MTTNPEYFIHSTSPTSYIEWLEDVIGSINDGILVIDSHEKVQLINEEYTRITGVTKKDIIGKKLSDVRAGAILPKTLKDGTRRSGIYRKEGSTEYVVDMAPVYQDGKIGGAVSVCKSLNEVHYLAKELKQSQKRIAELENTVEHFYQARYTFDDIIGKNGGLKETVEIAEKAALSDLNILIQGESGTGKELVAHAIHQVSTRKNYPLVPVNCAAIPSSLLESELFGYEEGSFTSSKKGGKKGLFELAHNGTIFLDEIGDLPLELQAKLLRVIQDGRIRKVGSLKEDKINVRVISATNKNLATMVEKQKFREDLYYRLNGIQVSIPPLRQRKQDISEMINQFVTNESASPALQLSNQAYEALLSYDWPGNVRELVNVFNYAISMADDRIIEIKRLPESIHRQSIAPQHSKSPQTLKVILQKTEQEVIEKTLQTFGNTLEGKKQAAKQLNISLATLYNKLQQHSKILE